MFRTSSRGALLGAASACVLALGDFGASWLWISDSLDRLALVLRLLMIEVPIGAAAGALIGAYAHASKGPMQRLYARFAAARREVWERRLSPLPYVLLASPGGIAVAWMLFTGGSASRLPMRPLLVAVAAFVLLAMVYVAIRVGRAVVERVQRGTRRTSIFAGIGLLVAYLAIAKIDQIILPGLYNYLHACLSVAAWLVAGLAVLSFAMHSKLTARVEDRVPAIGLGTLAVLAGVWLLGLFTLEPNQTVRVAMLSPRASASRSIMLGIGPIVALSESRAAAEAVDRARRARANRRRGRVEGPTYDGAHLFIITIDALRADHLGLYGYRTRPVSPYLDRLAERSVVFETAYATAPHSSYSLCSLASSEYLYQKIDLGLPIPDVTIASTLRELGYHTTAYYIDGIFHTDGQRMASFQESSFGFGQVNHANSNATERTEELLAEVDRIVEAGEPPTLLWGHYFDVHEPYEDTRYGTADIERYDGEIRAVDAALERFIPEAERRLERPVVIVITADHGEEFHDHGGLYHGSSVYQEQIRVPLIFYVEGMEPRRVATPVQLIDVAPTLLGFADMPVPPSMRGQDLRPLMMGRDVDYGPVFGSAGQKHMVVRWPYKLIADLRYGTRELFDLEQDPRERDNLADDHPELVAELHGEIIAWLDSLADQELSPHEIALHHGRLGDRSAVTGLVALLDDASARPEWRVEAAQHLAAISDRAGREALTRALDSDVAEVRDEAAISLAYLAYERAPRQPLRRMLEDEDEARQMRAAIGLARLGDAAALPVLIDVFGSSDYDRNDRFEAIRLSGLLRDRRAVEPLIDILDDERLRRRGVIALGIIGDPRAFEPLTTQLHTARHSTVRESSARGLGYLGDTDAIPHLLRAIPNESLPSGAESLVKLGAIERGAIGGIDLAPNARATGVTDCRRQPYGPDDAQYLNRTTCETDGPRTEMTLRLPESVTRARRVLVLLRTRRLYDGTATQATLRIGDRSLSVSPIDSGWTEHRFTIPAGELAPNAVLELASPTVRVALDHLLVIPLAE
jgi:arylsulfatase A-like enzyme/HEAT repeat protein